MQGKTKEVWKQLCEQAAAEQDPDKLLELVKQIDRMLDEKRPAYCAIVRKLASKRATAMARPRRKKQPRVRAIPPSKPEARDEGPRLLPLEEKQRAESRLDHYIKLANVALGLPRGDKRGKLPAKER